MDVNRGDRLKIASYNYETVIGKGKENIVVRRPA